MISKQKVQKASKHQELLKMNINKERRLHPGCWGSFCSCLITQRCSRSGVQVQSVLSSYTCEFDLSNPLRVPSYPGAQGPSHKTPGKAGSSGWQVAWADPLKMSTWYQNQVLHLSFSGSHLETHCKPRLRSQPGSGVGDTEHLKNGQHFLSFCWVPHSQIRSHSQVLEIWGWCIFEGPPFRETRLARSWPRTWSCAGLII